MAFIVQVFSWVEIVTVSGKTEITTNILFTHNFLYIQTYTLTDKCVWNIMWLVQMDIYVWTNVYICISKVLVLKTEIDKCSWWFCECNNNKNKQKCRNKISLYYAFIHTVDINWCKRLISNVFSIEALKILFTQNPVPPRIRNTINYFTVYMRYNRLTMVA